MDVQWRVLPQEGIAVARPGKQRLGSQLRPQPERRLHPGWGRMAPVTWVPRGRAEEGLQTLFSQFKPIWNFLESREQRKRKGMAV